MTIDRASYPGACRMISSDCGFLCHWRRPAEDEPSLRKMESSMRQVLSPSEVVAAFQMCDDLVSQMVPYRQPAAHL